ncbi:MAG TPA: hypothetical protein VEA15_06040 [Caulobacteraceae bacterium]|nr:hypothetical protein [Caulobacteraceae bacterium]
MDADRIRQWRDEGLSDAEIGHRLGVSADRLRQLLQEPAVDDRDDDHRPNTDPVR